jgi:hypothetical protein
MRRVGTDRADDTEKEIKRLIHQSHGQFAAADGRLILSDISDLLGKGSDGSGLSFMDVGSGQFNRYIRHSTKGKDSC